MARFRSHWLLVLTALSTVSSSYSEIGSLAFKYARGGQSEISDDVKRFIGVFGQTTAGGAQSFSFGSVNGGSVPSLSPPVSEPLPVPQPVIPLPAPVPLIAPAIPATPTCTDLFCNKIFELLKNSGKPEATETQESQDDVVPSEESRDRVLKVLKDNYLKIVDNIHQSFINKKNDAILKSMTGVLKGMKGLYGDKFENVAKELAAQFWKTYGKIEKGNQGESSGQDAAVREIERVNENLKIQADYYKHKLRKLYRKFKRVLRKKTIDFGDQMSQILGTDQDQHSQINQNLINKVRGDLNRKLHLVTVLFQKYSPVIFKNTILEDKPAETADDDAYQLPGKVYEIVHEVSDAQPDEGSHNFFRYFTRIYKKISVSLEEKSEDFLRLFVRSCFELSETIPDTIERYAVRFYKIFKGLYDIVSDKLHAGCSDDFIDILKHLSSTLNYTLGKRSESNFKKEFIRKWHLKFDNSYNDIYHYYAEKGSPTGPFDLAQHVQKVYEKSRTITLLGLDDYPDEEQQLFKYLCDEIGSDFSFASPEKARVFMRIYKEKQRTTTTLGEYLKDLYKLFDRTYDSVESDAIKNEDDFLKLFIATCQEFFGDNGQHFWKNYKYFTSFFHSVWKYTLKEKKSDRVHNELDGDSNLSKPTRDLEEHTSNSLVVPSNELPRISEEEHSRIYKKLADLIGQRFISQPKDSSDVFIYLYKTLYSSMKTNLDDHIIELHALFTSIRSAVQQDLINNLQAFVDIFTETAKSHFGNNGEKIWKGWRDFYQCFVQAWKKFLHDKEVAAAVTENPNQNTLPSLETIETKIQKIIPVGPTDDAAEFENLNKHLVDILGSVYEKSTGASSYCFIRLYKVLQAVMPNTVDSHIQEIYALFTHVYETFGKILSKNIDFVANCVIHLVQDVLNNNGAKIGDHWQHLLPHIKTIVDHIASSHTSKLPTVINAAINFVQGLIGKAPAPTEDSSKNVRTINIIIRIIKNFFVSKHIQESTTEAVLETTTIPSEPAVSQAPVHNFHVIHIIKNLFGSPEEHFSKIRDIIFQKITDLFGQNKYPETTAIPEYTTDSVTESVQESTTVPSEYETSTDNAQDISQTTTMSPEYTTDSVTESTTVPQDYETTAVSAQDSSTEQSEISTGIEPETSTEGSAMPTDTTADSSEVPNATSPPESDTVTAESSPLQVQNPGSSNSIIDIIKHLLGDSKVNIIKIWQSLAPHIASIWESLSQNNNAGSQSLEDFVKTILTVLPDGSPEIKPKPQKPGILYILNLHNPRQPPVEQEIAPPKPLVVNLNILQRAPPNLLHTLHLVARHYFTGLERPFFDFSSQLYQTDLERYNTYPSEFLKFLLLESAHHFHRPAILDALPGILHYYNHLITKLSDKVDNVGKTYSDLYDNLNQKFDEKLKENTEHIEKIASDLQDRVNEKLESKNKIDEIIESYAKLKTVFGEEKPQSKIIFKPSVINFHNSMDHYEINKNIDLAMSKKRTTDEDCETTFAPSTTLPTSAAPTTQTTLETTSESTTEVSTTTTKNESSTEPLTELSTIPTSPPTVVDTSPQTVVDTSPQTVVDTSPQTVVDTSPQTVQDTSPVVNETTTPLTTQAPTTTEEVVTESELPEDVSKTCDPRTKKCSPRKIVTEPTSSTEPSSTESEPTTVPSSPEPESSTVPPSTEPSTTTTQKKYGESSDIEISAAGHEEIFQATFNKVVQKPINFQKAFFSIFSRLHDQFKGHEFDKYAAELYDVLESTFSIYNEGIVSNPSFISTFISLYNQYYVGKGGEFKHFIRQLYEQQKDIVARWDHQINLYYEHKHQRYFGELFYKLYQHFDPVCVYQAAESMGENLKNVVEADKAVADAGRRTFMDYYGQCFMEYLQTEAGSKHVLANMLDHAHSSDRFFVSILFRSYYEYLRRFSTNEMPEAVIPFLRKFTEIYDSVKHLSIEDTYSELILLAIDNKAYGIEKTVDDFNRFLACSKGSVALSREDQALKEQMQSRYNNKFYPNLFCLFILHPSHTSEDFNIYDTYLRHYSHYYSLQFNDKYDEYSISNALKANIFWRSVSELMNRFGNAILYKIPLVVEFFESVFHRFNGTERSYEKFRTTFADVFEEYFPKLVDEGKLQLAIQKFDMVYTGEEELIEERLYRELQLTRSTHSTFDNFFYRVKSRLDTDYNEECFKVAFRTIIGDASDNDVRETDLFWTDYDNCYTHVNHEWHGVEYKEALTTLTNEKLEAFIQIMQSLAVTNITYYRKSLHISPLVENVYRNKPKFASHFVTIYRMYENTANGFQGLTNLFNDYYTINGKNFSLGTGEQYTKIYCPPQDNEKITYFPSHVTDLLDACLYPSDYKEITDKQQINQLEEELQHSAQHKT